MFESREGALQHLGLTPKSTIQDIRSSYRSLALKYHPDRADPNSSLESFINVSYAYAFVLDPDKMKLISREEIDISAANELFFSEFRSYFCLDSDYQKDDACSCENSTSRNRRYRPCATCVITCMFSDVVNWRRYHGKYVPEWTSLLLDSNRCHNMAHFMEPYLCFDTDDHPIALTIREGSSSQLLKMIESDTIRAISMLNYKNTPLHFAARFGRIDCAEILLHYGAKKCLVMKNDFGDTPPILAETSGFSDCETFFKKSANEFADECCLSLLDEINKEAQLAKNEQEKKRAKKQKKKLNRKSKLQAKSIQSSSSSFKDVVGSDKDKPSLLSDPIHPSPSSQTSSDSLSTPSSLNPVSARPVLCSETHLQEREPDCDGLDDSEENISTGDGDHSDEASPPTHLEKKNVQERMEGEEGAKDGPQEAEEEEEDCDVAGTYGGRFSAFISDSVHSNGFSVPLVTKSTSSRVVSPSCSPRGGLLGIPPDSVTFELDQSHPGQDENPASESRSASGLLVDSRSSLDSEENPHLYHSAMSSLAPVFSKSCQIGRDHGDASKVEICRYFIRGHCREGKKCRFSHSFEISSKNRPFDVASSHSSTENSKLYKPSSKAVFQRSQLLLRNSNSGLIKPSVENVETVVVDSAEEKTQPCNSFSFPVAPNHHHHHQQQQQQQQQGSHFSLFGVDPDGISSLSSTDGSSRESSLGGWNPLSSEAATSLLFPLVSDSFSGGGGCKLSDLNCETFDFSNSFERNPFYGTRADFGNFDLNGCVTCDLSDVDRDQLLQEQKRIIIEEQKLFEKRKQSLGGSAAVGELFSPNHPSRFAMSCAKNEDTFSHPSVLKSRKSYPSDSVGTPLSTGVGSLLEGDSSSKYGFYSHSFGEISRW